MRDLEIQQNSFFIGGIPRYALKLSICNRTPIETKSGKTLNVQREQKRISIRDDETLCQVMAEVSDDHFLQAVVRTKLAGTNFRHEDLHASQLLHEELVYLKGMGNDIVGFRAQWSIDPLYSDNRENFIYKLKKNGISLSDLNDKDKKVKNKEVLASIVKTMWSGVFAQKEDYTEVKDIYVDSDGTVNVEFVPKQENKQIQKTNKLSEMLQRVRKIVRF